VPNGWLTADRKQIRKAREAAEALFKPKQHQQRPEPPPTVHAPRAAASPTEIPRTEEEPAARNPRVLNAPSAMPIAGDQVTVSDRHTAKPKRPIMK